MRGLVLEGGGARGSYQIGAYKAMRSLGMDFDGVVGTSIGSLNAAFIVQGDVDMIEDIWINHDYSHFINVDEDFYNKYKNINGIAFSITNFVDMLNIIVSNKEIDITPLRELLERTIDEDKIRNSCKDFGFVTVCVDKGLVPCHLYIEDVPEGQLINYLLASCSLPIFKNDKIDEKIYLDGVFSDNIPVELLKQKGYTDIVVVRLVDDIFGKMHLTKYKDLDIKIIVPSENLGGCLNKDYENVSKNMLLGYYDTLKFFEKLQGVKYFFQLDTKFEEKYCFDIFAKLDEKTIESLCKILNIKQDSSMRVLFETIIPKASEMIGLDKDFTYKDLYFRIYEKKLEENNINRINVYNFAKVVDIVNKNIDSGKDIVEKLGTTQTLPINILLKKNKKAKLLVNTFLRGLSKISSEFFV